MTTKPIAMWCCVDPSGKLVNESLASKRTDSIYAARLSLVWSPSSTPWSVLRAQGYRCKRFILSEAEGER